MIRGLASTLALALFAATLSAPASAQLYRWVDEKGVTRYSDRPPPASAKDVQKKSGGPSSDVTGAEPYALQVARKKYPVTLWSSPDCGKACDDARGLLNARGVPFKEISVVEPKQADELKALVGSPAVPTLVVGSSTQKGYEEGLFHRLLDGAGYPKTGVLPARNQPAPSAEAPPPEVKPAPPPPSAEAEPRGPYSPLPPPPEKKK